MFFDGIYESATVRKIEEVILEGEVMIDAGANIGAISLPLAKRKDIKIFAFEPARHIFGTLEKNISVNRVTNMKAFPLALSNRSGAVDFYESATVHGWSGVVKIEGFEHYSVEAVTLDDFATANRIESVGVLKADVQGWEYFVFKGAEKLIKQKRIKNIIFEFEWWAEKNAGLPVGRAQEFLLENGYSLRTLSGKSLAKPVTAGTFIIHASI